MMRLPRRVSSSVPSSFSAAAVLSGVLGLAMLLPSETAEAGHVRFGGGAHFSGHFGGGVSVRYARPYRPYWRPRVWVGGSVWVGSYYVPRPYYYYYYPYTPEYVPSYYGSYYPVQPGVAAPGAVVVEPPRPSLPTFGIGVFAGGTNVQDREDSTDLGALVRLRLTPGLLLEGELGKTSFKNNVRVDRRLGGSLIYEFGAYNSFAPYVLAGGGVQQDDVDGSFTTTQDFGELGVGLRWALSRNLHLTFDIRAGRRKTIDSNQPDGIAPLRTISPPTGGINNDTEDYTRGRLAAILNF